jgi:cephalosporin hydroxylase
MVVIQELIWQIKPDLIIETGIAQGGSLIMSVSMLSILLALISLETPLPFDRNFRH